MNTWKYYTRLNSININFYYWIKCKFYLISCNTFHNSWIIYGRYAMWESCWRDDRCNNNLWCEYVWYGQNWMQFIVVVINMKWKWMHIKSSKNLWFHAWIWEMGRETNVYLWFNLKKLVRIEQLTTTFKHVLYLKRSLWRDYRIFP